MLSDGVFLIGDLSVRDLFFDFFFWELNVNMGEVGFELLVLLRFVDVKKFNVFKGVFGVVESFFYGLFGLFKVLSFGDVMKLLMLEKILL